MSSLARRFLHVCYCCGDAEAAAGLLAEGLALRVAMRTPPGLGDGAILGFEPLARREALALPPALLGPGAGRVRAARMRLPDEPLELLLLQWLDPPSTGDPYAEPNHVGLYRMAIAVDDTRDSVRRLEGAGRPVERSPRLVALEGTRVPEMWIAFLRDPDGVPVELVERPRSAFR